ncbi:alpha-2-macroglobulin [Klebsormidium nitens]|uniref:Alpha-2-macroglobulin n=1 Tax=Klebsormidium nitens TaxID=105231 RepID=A0A1Y1IAY1_KLENI|nr:alpha-2-macroglobulin [Klebsormidium nitens]|eukprot:GAQ87713.1 alpha-2-macroglobulin [Klebsormidium nitens]
MTPRLCPLAGTPGEYPDWQQYAECLTSDTRWSTHLSTDKLVYRPGDTVHIRAVLLHPITGAPVSKEPSAYGKDGTVKVMSPKGSVEASVATSQPEDSVAYAMWRVPESLPGGEYTLKLEYSEYNQMRCSPSAERKIQIRNFRNPKLNVRVEFLGRGYGPGDEVRAKVSVTRAEGGHPPAGTRVNLSARVDGCSVYSEKGGLDDSGVCYTTFKLPPKMEKGLGSLSAMVRDGGHVESGSKTIPIVFQTVDVKFYPEGGPLVPGLENRVYFEARDPKEEPLEVAGEVWAVGGNAPLATFAAVHEGRGRFVFTPTIGTYYEARITKPSGITKPIRLPHVEYQANHGLPRVVLRVNSPGADVEMTDAGTPQNPGDSVPVSVGSSAPAKLRVVLYKREVALNRQDIDISAARGFQQVSLYPPGAEYSGVLRATVFAESRDKKWTPVAERLVFRAPINKLHVAVSGGPAQGGGVDCVPGGGAKVEVTVTDAITGEPINGAVVGLSVVDNINLELVEPRRRAPRLPSMALLENEVNHLEDSAAYVDGSDLPGGSDPSLAVDLLLGTQGWRRFLYLNPLEKLRGSSGSSENKEKFERAAGVRALEYWNPEWEMARRSGRYESSQIRSLARGEESARIDPTDGYYDGLEESDVWECDSEEDDFAEPDVDEDWLPADVAADVAADVGSDEEDAGAQPEPAERAIPKRQKQHHIVPVRVYAHRRPKQQSVHERSDFTETVYFAASLVTDAHGKACAEFDVSDSITSFAVIADAHKEVTLDPETGATVTASPTQKWRNMPGSKSAAVAAFAAGAARTVRTVALGASDGVFKLRSVKPFSVDAKCPLELTAGDRVLLPVTLANASLERLSVTAQVGVRGPLSLEASPPGGNSTGANTAGRKSSGPVPMDVDTPGASEPASSTVLKQSLDASRSAREIVPVVAGGAALAAAYKSMTSDEPNPLPRGFVTVNAAASFGGGVKKGGLVLRDEIKRGFAVTPKGFPQEQSAGGMLKPGTRSGGEFALPEDTQPGSVVTSVTVFPCPLANFAHSLSALVREPYGCFEQASATIYPNILAQQYFKTHTGSSPSLVEKSYTLLGQGLKKLRGYEVNGSGGYEWFGHAPAHESMTAYGLMEFVDMAQVYPVPEDMIRRTRAWLLSRKDDSARAFRINPRLLEHFGGAPADVTNAYIVWALTTCVAQSTKGLSSPLFSTFFPLETDGLSRCRTVEITDGDRLVAALKHVGSTSTGRASEAFLFSPQIANLLEQTATNRDPYFTALVANSLYNLGRKEEAAALAKRLEISQKEDGHVAGAKTSITSSGGESLLIETTALTTLCWLNEYQVFGGRIRRAVDWIASRCNGGKFGSSQGTVLALKAIVAYDVMMASERAPGTVHLLVDGERVESKAFDGKTEGTIAFGDISARLAADGRKRRVEVEMEGGADMPHAMQVSYYSERPSSAAACAVALAAALQQPIANEGDLVDILLTVENKKESEALPMTIAILGLPGGLEPRPDQLRELVTRGDVDLYELRGRDVIFYWRTLAAKQKVTLRLEATAAVPGEYVGPASRAYLYYTDELKTWADPIKCSIVPK